MFELCGYKSGISMKDLCFIAYAGSIRGAVAFGLVLRVDDDVVNKQVIVTTSLSLVVFTTIVLGSTVATMQRFLYGKLEEAEPKLGKGEDNESRASIH